MDLQDLTENNTLTNAKIIPNNMTDLWPFASTFNNYYYNVTSYESLKSVIPIIVGNVTYIAPGETVPNDYEQYGRVFLLDDTIGCQEKLDNITRAEATIIIDDGAIGIGHADVSKTNVNVISFNETEGNTVKELLFCITGATRIGRAFNKVFQNTTDLILNLQ